jgi:phthiodiolone/phenolphthiodiolone dimycocerosates ketoreductase
MSFSGSHFQLDRATMDLKAPPGRVPQIWVGGQGRRMLRLAGRYGDGWYPASVVSPQEYSEKLAVVRSAATEAGRAAASITPALHRFVVFGSTEQEAREMLKHRAIRLLGLGAPAQVWRRAGVVHPLGEGFNAIVDFVPDRHDRAQIEEAIAAVPEEVMTEGSLLWGTPEQVTAKLRAFGEAGLRHVILAPVSGLVSRRAALYGLRAAGQVARALRH